jgi:D-alanine-D-alanine ligase
MAATKHVAVLLGGFSSEREVSLSSGRECAKALEERGYRVTRIDVGRNVGRELFELKPDVVFNALHGPFGEDGTIQGVLEFLGLPYTHSGVLASALAMNKEKAKVLFAAAGIPLADHRIVNRLEAAREHVLPPPYVLKPIAEGSSYGVLIVREDAEHPPQELFREDWRYGELLMAERYVPGKELTCAVIGDRATEVLEIVPVGHAFYDYESKYVPGGSRHEVPARLSPNVNQNCRKLTLEAHRALGCRGVSRADFRFDPSREELVLLEVNTQPGMTPTSLVPDLAAHDGMSFGELVEWMVEDASCGR